MRQPSRRLVFSWENQEWCSPIVRSQSSIVSLSHAPLPSWVLSEYCCCCAAGGNSSAIRSMIALKSLILNRSYGASVLQSLFLFGSRNRRRELSGPRQENIRLKPPVC